MIKHQSNHVTSGTVNQITSMNALRKDRLYGTTPLVKSQKNSSNIKINYQKKIQTSEIF